MLLHQDQVPPVFEPQPEELQEFLFNLHKIANQSLVEQISAAQTEIQQEVEQFSRTLDPALSEAEKETAIAAFRNEKTEELKIQLTEANILATLAQYLELEPEILAQLMQTETDETTGAITSPAILTALSDSREPAITDFVIFAQFPNDDEAPEITSTSAYDNAKNLLIRLDKVARILKHLSITPQELEAIWQVRLENTFIDFNLIPYDDATASPVDIVSLQALVEAKQLQSQLPQGERDLFNFLQEAYTKDNIAQYLHQHTGWDEEVITRLSTNLGFDTPSYQQVGTYRKLAQAIQMMRRLGIDAETLERWGNPATLEENLARELFAQTEAKYPDESRWYKVLTPIMHLLREKKRDALIDYLIHHPQQWLPPATIAKLQREGKSVDVNLLYAHYLIDVEMSSCQFTSRIKQAVGSIQLFIQRCLLGLEDNISLSDRDNQHWQQWEWMKNYRVWEANRKVFLYPENWIEPDLRDNKSPFFEALENELLQGEVNSDRIENAYINYLQKLAEVARLDVRGLYYEEEQNVLHIFARTFSEPHIYYYRKRLAEQTWTSWERIDLDIRLYRK